MTVTQLQPRLDRRILIAKRVDAGLHRMRLHVSDATRRTAIARATCAAERTPVEDAARSALDWILGHEWPTNTPPSAA